MGAAFIAVGIFCSSFTENQIVSAVVSFIALIVLYLFTTIGNLIPVEFISNIFSKLSFWERYYGFTYGLFDLSNVLFFISAAVVFLFLSVRVLERRRWA